MGLQTASTRGRVTIPINIRRKLGIEAGTPIRFVERDGEVVLERINMSLSSLCGIFTANASLELAEIDKHIAAAVAEKALSDGSR